MRAKRNADEGKAGQAPSHPPVDTERRQITALAAMALLGGATITIASCGGGTPSGPSAGFTPLPSPPTPTCPSGAACGVVSSDPTHTAMITAAQLAAGGALVLDIVGNSSHGHLVQLSADEVVAVREHRHVEKRSSVELGHSHLVTFN